MGSVAGFHVAFDHDLNEEDAEKMRQAFMFFKNVVSVEPCIADFHQWISETRARQELGQKIIDVIYPPKGGAA